MKKALFFILATLISSLLFLPQVTAQSESVTLKVGPLGGKLAQGGDNTIALNFSSPQKISAFNLTLSSEGSLEMVDVSSPVNSENPKANLSSKEVIKKVSKNSAQITYVLISPTSSLPQNLTLGVKVKGSGEGRGTLKIDQSRSQFIGAGGNKLGIAGDLTVAFDFEKNTSPVIAFSFTSPNTPVVNLTLKAGGIKNASSQKLAAQVRVVGPDGKTSILYPLELSVGEGGVLIGSFEIKDFTPKDNLKILIKGPMHLQKAICETNPKETEPGKYACTKGSISIKPGQNNFDFTGISLIPGDLSPQDGKLNGYDYSQILNNLGSKDSKILSLFDLNLDGIIDKKDLGLLDFVSKNFKGIDQI